MTWQPAAILYPDAEQVACDAIRPLLVSAGQTGVYVGNKIPNPRRDRMVIWNCDGGNASDMRDRPRMRCRVWATDDKAANDLARLIVALMPLMVDGAPILRVEHLSGPYDVPDESRQVQKFLLFEMHMRGEPL